ncbi:choline/ethanolamine kinase [Theileria orientalis]|uniref:ethanolamine kinase n=1 Tax=Theileria orientalis TaxID=68886 RepID=A0A976M4K8_THEOR|nr:choline/ethanolamine kinase [Theileria orientalis]
MTIPSTELSDSDGETVGVTHDKCIDYCVKLVPKHLGLAAESYNTPDIRSPDSDRNLLKVDQVFGGITNSLYKVTNTINGKSVLVRIFGSHTSRIIDRTRERYICELLSKFQISKSVYCYFKEGQIEEWIEGRNLTHNDLINSTYLVKIAQNLKKLHSISIDGDISRIINGGSDVPKSCLWSTLWNYYKLCQRYVGKNRIKASDIDFKELEKKISALETVCNSVNSPLVLCHCDLLSGNIILLPDGNVRFIDFEYCCCMERAFDIANHFNEYMGFTGDFDLIPDVDTQKKFIREYLKFDITELRPSLEGFCGFNQVSHSEAAVDDLVREIQPFFMASHILWGIWSLLQSGLSNVEFDFLRYAKKRIGYFMNSSFWELF